MSNIAEKIKALAEQTNAVLPAIESVTGVIDSGSLLVNKASGVDGYPRGRIIEIYGQESSGKTTLLMHAMKSAVENGLVAGILDVEHALDPQYCVSMGLGVENKDFLVARPETFEETIDILEMWITEGVSLIGIDSIAAMVPKAELEGDTGESHMGLQARLMSQTCRRLKGKIYDSGTIVIFINQTRSKIGVVFGNPETTPGGNAMKYYASMRIRTGITPEVIKIGQVEVGRYMSVVFKKNKVSVPFKKALVPIVFGVGVHRGAELFDLMITAGILVRKGSNYYLKDELLGVGKGDAFDKIDENYDYCVRAYNEYKGIT